VVHLSEKENPTIYFFVHFSLQKNYRQNTMSQVPLQFDFLTPSGSAWGPSSTVPENLRFHDIPYAPYSKSDKLGKAADWQQSKEGGSQQQSVQKNVKLQRGQRDQYHAYGASAAASFAAENDEDGEFSVVDSSISTAKDSFNLPNAQSNNQNNQNANQQRQPTVLRGKKSSVRPQTQRKPGYSNSTWYNNRMKEDINKNRESSIKVSKSWKIISDIEFSKLTKLNLEVGPGSDVRTFGSVPLYQKTFEKLNNGVSAPLKASNRHSINPTVSKDPIIKELAEKKEAKVFFTSNVLTQLMCASRASYSWDVIVTRKGDNYYFDKRDGSILDKVTVDENSSSPPSDTHDTNINNADNLITEATIINDNFVDSTVVPNAGVTLDTEEPPFPIGKDILPKGYRYRKFLLPENDEEAEPLPIIVRTPVDAYMKDQGFVSVKALNQYDPKEFDWKVKLTQQRGAIMASEMKKNNNKISNWTTEAILTGNDTIKIGFVARNTPKSNQTHVILGVATYKPQDLSAQIGLQQGNGWGIVKSLIDIIRHEYEHGDATEQTKFVVTKDPKASKLVLYAAVDGILGNEEDESV